MVKEMNRNDAIALVLAEAFSDHGLAVLANEGQDPGHQRMESLIAAINFLADDLSTEDHLGRALVSALFILGNQVPEDLELGIPPSSDSRCSLFQQVCDLTVDISVLIENWDNWPDDNGLATYSFKEPSDESTAPSDADEEFEGYRIGDITYCVVPNKEEIFPVRVVRLGFNVIEVEPLDAALGEAVCKSFSQERTNRCFRSPRLPNVARFGGWDERPVNSDRKSGSELRLLPAHYATTTGKLIRDRHANDPDRWPLPTGIVYERWFKDAASKEQ